MNYSELLQLAKGWSNFVSDRINILRLQRKWRMGRKVPQGIRPGRERPAPSQMEKRAIRTDKGEVNRQIVSDNKLREDLKAVERLRKAADQLARQEQDKSHDRGPEL